MKWFKAPAPRPQPQGCSTQTQVQRQGYYPKPPEARLQRTRLQCQELRLRSTTGAKSPIRRLQRHFRSQTAEGAKAAIPQVQSQDSRASSLHYPSPSCLGSCWGPLYHEFSTSTISIMLRPLSHEFPTSQPSGGHSVPNFA